MRRWAPFLSLHLFKALAEQLHDQSARSLKSTRYHLENDLKSNEEKLRRLAERMARAADAQATEET